MPFYRNPVIIAVIVEAFAAAAMVAGIAPRETAFVVAAAGVLLIAFVPVPQAALFTVLSIPVAIALPFGLGFDNFASWRLFVAALFLSWLFHSGVWRDITQLRIKTIVARFTLLDYIATAFLAVALLSLAAASDPYAGIKRILFLVNIALLYIVVRHVAYDTRRARELLWASAAAGIAVLCIGYFQYALIAFFSLYDFWKAWTDMVIPVFYGEELANLLSGSNTWFSYYADNPPTLRMFSLLPDSHSFAVFSMLAAVPGLALAAEELFSSPINRALSRPRFLIAAAIVPAAFFAIYFSGSRGVWLAAAALAFLGTAGALFAHSRIPEFIKKAALYCTLFAVGSTLTILFFQNLALLYAYDICERYSFLCNPVFLASYGLPGSLAIVGVIGGGAFLGLTILLRAWVWVEPRWKPFMSSALMPCAIFMLLLPVASFFSSRAHGYGVGSEDETFTMQRAKTVFDVTETSNRARLDIWILSAQAMLREPLVGVGIGNYPLVLAEDTDAAQRGASAHNLYLEFGAETGVLGMALLAFFFLEIVRMNMATLRARGSPERYFFAAVFSVYTLWLMGYNFFDVVLLNDKVALFFATLLGIAVAWNKGISVPSPRI